MNVLMIYPKYPQQTLWNIDRSVQRFTMRHSTMPPLGLLAIASYLPKDFQVRLIDRNITEEKEADWHWADIVFLSLMLVQREDYEVCVSNARKRGKRIAVGGPFTSAMREVVAAEVDWVCFGEAESIMEEFISDLRADRHPKQYNGGSKTNMQEIRIPQYELIPNINDYYIMPVQFSRGCPFQCEFCDITEIYGNVTRTKSPAQILEELNTIKSLGFRGCIFLVDDNFVGNKGNAQRMLEELAIWNYDNGYPFYFYTQASINLADEEKLMDAMGKANVSFVFLGIETPDSKLLKTTKKYQNMKGNTLEKLSKIRQHGIHISAGMIVGLDGEDQHVFEVQNSFIESSGIGVVLFSLLEALPHTQLSRRLKAEGRLLESLPIYFNNTVEGMNFIPKGEMTKRQYLERFVKIIHEIYSAKAFFRRILPALLVLRKNVGFKITRDISLFMMRQIYYMGIREKGMRFYYWKTFIHVSWKNPRALGGFFSDCLHYYHLFRHRTYVVKTLRNYLLHPDSGDVLDKVIACNDLPTEQHRSSHAGEIIRNDHPVKRSLTQLGVVDGN